jgi:hypothetical protein
MTSTFSPSLRLTLQADGDNQNLWGAVANSVFTLLEASIAGVTTVNVSGADVTLTTVQGGADQARAAILVITGILTNAINVIIPSVPKGYWVWGNYTVSTTGAGNVAVTVKTAGGTGVSITPGGRSFVFCDGSNVIQMSGDPNIARITSGTITGLNQPLPITAGGTGSNSLSGIVTTLGLQDAAFTTVAAIVAQASGSASDGTVSSAGGTFTGNIRVAKTNPVLDGNAATNGQVTLESSTQPRIGFNIPNVGAGSIYMANSGEFRIRYNTNQDVPISIPIGGIIEWSGALSSLPQNYHACDGTNGTPDLRDRFIISAGASFAVGTTGGSTSATSSASTVTISGTTDSQGAHSHGGATGNTTLTLSQIPGHAHTQQGTFTSGTETAAHSHTFPVTGGSNDFNFDAGNASRGDSTTLSGTFSTSSETVGHAHITTISGATDTQGGSAAHGHSISSDGAHTHSLSATTGSHSHTVSVIPPYFALFKIYRLF